MTYYTHELMVITDGVERYDDYRKLNKNEYKHLLRAIKHDGSSNEIMEKMKTLETGDFDTLEGNVLKLSRTRPTDVFALYCVGVGVGYDDECIYFKNGKYQRVAPEMFHEVDYPSFNKSELKQP